MVVDFQQRHSQIIAPQQKTPHRQFGIMATTALGIIAPGHYSLWALYHHRLLQSAPPIIIPTTDQIIPFDTGPTIHPWYTVGVGSFDLSRKITGFRVSATYANSLYFAPCSVIRTFALLTFCGFYAIVRAWKFKQSSVPSRLPTFSHSQTAVLSVRMRNSPTLIERETAPLTLAPKQIARSMSSSVSERANT